jgi:3-oxoacyl-[acyl-carrier protein] reductase
MGRLEGRIALITGAARGIGASIGRRFAVVNDIDRVGAEKTAADLRGEAIPADVADSAAVRGMFERVASEYGRLDVLVNNAGISGAEEDQARVDEYIETLGRQAGEIAAGGPIETHLDTTVELEDEAWHRMIGIHLDGTFFCCREALKIMGPQMSGAIINMGSIMGTTGGAGSLSYCAAKGGILGLTRSLAREVVTRNIRVNAIAPGWIDTDMLAPLGLWKQMIAAQTPMRRLGDVDDIAWAAVYLASDEAKFVTGQVLSPNGGWYMSQ